MNNTSTKSDKESDSLLVDLINLLLSVNENNEFAELNEISMEDVDGTRIEF